LPEIWVPFGSVEALVTIQAENLGSVVQPDPEKSDGETERFSSLVKEAKSLFVCDTAPTTIEFLKDITKGIGSLPDLRVMASAPKRVESSVPELKGRIATLPPPLPSAQGEGPTVAPARGEPGTKVFLGTGRPDPVFGLVDTKVAACLNWVSQSHSESAKARKDMEPSPFSRTESYDRMMDLAEQINEGTFLTVLSRGGKVRTVMQDAPFDAIKNGFLGASVSPAKALIVGLGGSGFDDTLSSALRGVWGPLSALRRAGALLLVAECSEGLGAPALEMVATGRISGEVGKKRERYVEGLEEVFYLNKLTQEYDVLLLSGLPEVYSKSKLGLTTARGSGEAVGRLLNKAGRAGKVNVVTRACECRVESA
jgi:hypothetical protein